MHVGDVCVCVLHVFVPQGVSRVLTVLCVFVCVYVCAIEKENGVHAFIFYKDD